MPNNISDRVGRDLSGYTPAPPPASTQQLEQPLLPVRDSKLRFSAPNIPGSFPSSDTLIGYHLGGMIPQWRIPTAPSQSSSGTTIVNQSAAVFESGSTTIPSKLGLITSASFNIPPLSPGAVYTGSLPLLGEAWVFYGFTASYVMRLRGYGTQTAQTTDISRPITQGPGFGTAQDIIFDVNLTELPASWDFTPTATGVNNNPGISQLLYLSVTNNSSSIAAGSATLTYAPISAYPGQL